MTTVRVKLSERKHREEYALFGGERRQEVDESMLAANATIDKVYKFWMLRRDLAWQEIPHIMVPGPRIFDREKKKWVRKWITQILITNILVELAPDNITFNPYETWMQEKAADEENQSILQIDASLNADFERNKKTTISLIEGSVEAVAAIAKLFTGAAAVDEANATKAALDRALKAVDVGGKDELSFLASAIEKCFALLGTAEAQQRLMKGDKKLKDNLKPLSSKVDMLGKKVGELRDKTLGYVYMRSTHFTCICTRA